MEMKEIDFLTQFFFQSLLARLVIHISTVVLLIAHVHVSSLVSYIDPTKKER